MAFKGREFELPIAGSGRTPSWLEGGGSVLELLTAGSALLEVEALKKSRVICASRRARPDLLPLPIASVRLQRASDEIKRPGNAKSLLALLSLGLLKYQGNQETAIWRWKLLSAVLALLHSANIHQSNPKRQTRQPGLGMNSGNAGGRRLGYETAGGL